MNIKDLRSTALEDLLPHRPPMVLLSRALGLREDAFEAEVDLGPGSPFAQGGAVPAWVALEYMAQTTAAYAGAEGRATGQGPKVGMLLGTRDFRATVDHYSLGQTLSVRVKKVIQQENGVSAVEGVVLNAKGELLASAELTVIEIQDLALLAGLQGAGA